MSLASKLVLSFLLLMATTSFGQTEFIDSLIQVYQSTSEKEEKTMLAIKISSNLLHVDDDKSKFFAHKAVEHAEQTEDQVLIARANEAVAGYYSANGNFLGSANVYLKSLSIYESNGMIKEAAAVSNNIANAYLGVDDLEKADVYYQKSYDFGIQIKDTNAIAVPLVGLGILYHLKGETETALEYLNEAIPLFEGIGRQDALVVCYVNAASYAHELGKEYDFDYLEKAKTINNTLLNKYYSGSILMSESKWLAEDKKYKEAVIKGEQALSDLLEVKAFHDVEKAYDHLSSIYHLSGDYQKAFNHLKESVQLKDSLKEINRLEVMEEMDAKYNKAKDEQQIAALSHKNNLQELENQKNRTIIYISIGGSIVLLLLLGFAFNANRQKNKANKELQLQKSIIEEKNNEILDSIQYAKRIQNAIIPSENLVNKHLSDCFVFYKPKDIVAGDFYWMEEINNILLFAVADCTGHGVPGAMVSVVCHNALNRAVREFKLSEPSEILNKTRELVIETFSKSEENVKDGMDISLCAWNKLDNSLKWAGANNPLYIVPAKSNDLKILAPDKQPIGLFENSTSYTSHSVDLQKGDCLYLFSDGYVDQFGGKDGKKYKYSQFRKFLLESIKEKMPEQGKLLAQEFNSWKGDLEQLDDVCVVGLRI